MSFAHGSLFGRVAEARDPRSEPLRRFCVENQFARNRDPIAKKLAILIACFCSIDESNQRRRNSSRTTSYRVEESSKCGSLLSNSAGCVVDLIKLLSCN